MPEKIRIGVIHRHRFVPAGGEHDWEFSSFAIGADAIDFWRIFDSAFATPSRYVQEMFLRLARLEAGGGRGAKLVFNPLFEATWLTIAQVLAALDARASFQGMAVFADQDGLPAAYLFPSGFTAADSRFLTLLSAADAGTDAELCRRLFFCDVRLFTVARLSLARVLHNGFVYEENKGIYQWTAERAKAMLEPLAGLPLSEAISRRNAIPFTAVMPHHAGDVLFFALAWNRVETHVGRLAVNKTYCDIAADLAPGLALLPIEQPPANRSDDFRQGKVTPEHDYFRAFRDGLPGNSFYYYCRPSRDYNLTRFHLIDHFAFALGRRSCVAENLLSRQCPVVPFKPDIPAEPVRVLLHFDAGWSLKVYPKDAQEHLIDLLHAKGCRITVLAGTTYEHPKCRVTTFRGYGPFKELVKSHHILVGMDSFPSHYAAHVLGLPTICLFASTRPENSDAPSALNYARLEKGLSCRPCYGIARCPANGKDYCGNFVGPEVVAAEVVRMLESVRKQLDGAPATILRQVGDDCLPAEPEGAFRVKRISLRHLRAKVLVLGFFLPYGRYGALLYREFSAAVKREGVLSAVFRALRFLRKVARR